MDKIKNMNRINFLNVGAIMRVRSMMIAVVIVFVMMLLASCGSGGLKGTYVACNDAAKQNCIAKFEFQAEEEKSFLGEVFKKNTVKIYFGVMGYSMGVAAELRYKLKGERLIIEGGIPGVDAGSIEFKYNKATDEISMNVDYAFDMLGEIASHFGKTEGQKDTIKMAAEALKNKNKEETTPRWNKSGNCETKDVLTNPPTQGENDSSPGVKKGKLIFLTHGLNDNKGECFAETVKYLKKNGNYHDYGRVSASYVKENENKSQYINQLTDEGKNVLVRLEFSEGNLSFAKQLEEMGKMLAIFDGQNADVVFVGHSMGGLASINYGVEYAGTYKDKKIKIITVSTPFNPNNYAKFAWDNKYNPNVISTLIVILQNVGDAHRDLGGVGDAFSNLRNKWNENRKDIELHTIGIIGSSNNVIDRNDRGDGIIDIYTQLGAVPDWGNISSQFTITRNDNNNAKLDFVDTSDLYHHCKSSNLPQVANRINDIINKN
jgi:hypothetical protein